MITRARSRPSPLPRENRRGSDARGASARRGGALKGTIEKLLFGRFVLVALLLVPRIALGHPAPPTTVERLGETRVVLTFPKEDLELRLLREEVPSGDAVFADSCRRGRRHIAEGADHLLFLFLLLLPAPARRAVGQRVAAVVLAFSVGHALTLAATVTGGIVLAPRAQSAVEIGLACSIVLAALDAARPPKRDHSLLLGGAGGLLHGLAFAGVFRAPPSTPAALAKGLFAFHLGIEVTQLALVAATLPWMLKLRAPQEGEVADQEPYRYFVFRVSSAVLSAIVASGWIAERAFGCQNPFAPLSEGLVAHPILAMVGFAAVMSISSEGAKRLRAEAIPREHR